jgi:Flp pilus assembly protein TadG
LISGAARIDGMRSSGVMIQAIRAGLAAGTRRLSPARLFRIRTVRRFARGEDGIAAVEFGIVAAPFLALMFAIMETALVFFAGQTLETAVADSARLVMTGQADKFTEQNFRDEVCKKILGLFDCASGLKIDVKVYDKFSSISNAKPIDANKNLINNFGFQQGAPGDIVVVKLMYEWPTYMSFSLSWLKFDLSDLSGNKRLLMATAAFRNEPYK